MLVLRPTLLLAVAVSVAPSHLAAQTAVVERDVNLRTDPSTAHPPLTVLTAGTRHPVRLSARSDRRGQGGVGSRPECSCRRREGHGFTDLSPLVLPSPLGGGTFTERLGPVFRQARKLRP